MSAVGDPRSTTPPNSMTWTIPLHVTVTLGTPVVGAHLSGDGAPNTIAGGLPLPSTGAEEGAEGLYDDRFSRASLSVPGFSWRKSLSLALASRLAYRSAGDVVAVCRGQWGFAACEFVAVADTQAFVASSQDAVLVAFRGTESLRDWLGNLNIAPRARSYGPVHSGFFNAWSAVAPRIDALLASYPTPAVHVTGHSLGGALAVLATIESGHRDRFTSLYTYGQPRVGRAQAARYVGSALGDRFQRFVNDDDIVPRVPPGFDHAGVLRHFREDGRLHEGLESVFEAVVGQAAMPLAEFQDLQEVLQSARAPETVQEAAMAQVELEGLLPSFSDHSIERYVEKIARQPDA